MRRALLLLFLVATPLAAEDEIFDTVDGHACFRELLHKSGWGLAGPTERAAFVVEQGDGSIQCQEWPVMNIYHGDLFHGVPPEHTIAIVHTHPAAYPLPSEQDNDEATRLGIPIYTVTIRAVYKSLPGDPIVHALALKQSWIRQIPSTSIAAGKGSVSASR
jgi:JAB domain-containing protein similar to deubiquitination enzymes